MNYKAMFLFIGLSLTANGQGIQVGDWVVLDSSKFITRQLEAPKAVGGLLVINADQGILTLEDSLCRQYIENEFFAKKVGKSSSTGRKRCEISLGDEVHLNLEFWERARTYPGEKPRVVNGTVIKIYQDQITVKGKDGAIKQLHRSYSVKSKGPNSRLV